MSEQLFAAIGVALAFCAIAVESPPGRVDMRRESARYPVLCPLTSVRCPLSSVLCPLTSEQGARSTERRETLATYS